MARGIDRLSDRQIRAWLSKGTAPTTTNKLGDGAGLHLVRTTAGASWRVKYSFLKQGKRVPRLYSIGPYPHIGLSDARAERDRVRSWLAEGRDPVLERQLARQVQSVAGEATFEQIAREWLERRRARRRWSDVHHRNTVQALERDILPALGRFPIQRITPRMITAAFDPMLRRGVTETASKQLQNVVRIFARAKALQLITVNPAVDLREELIPERGEVEHHAAILTVPELRQVLRDFEYSPQSPQVRMLNRLIAFTVVRHTNAIEAEWSQFDLESDSPEWVIPREQMKRNKGGTNFRVPLSKTIAAELRQWRKMTGGKGLLFRSLSVKRKTLTPEALEGLSCARLFRTTYAARLAKLIQHAREGERAV